MANVRQAHEQAEKWDGSARGLDARHRAPLEFLARETRVTDDGNVSFDFRWNQALQICRSRRNFRRLSECRQNQILEIGSDNDETAQPSCPLRGSPHVCENFFDIAVRLDAWRFRNARGVRLGGSYLRLREAAGAWTIGKIRSSRQADGQLVLDDQTHRRRRLGGRA